MAFVIIEQEVVRRFVRLSLFGSIKIFITVIEMQ